MLSLRSLRSLYWDQYCLISSSKTQRDQCTLSKFADDSKLSGAADTPKEWNTIPGNPAYLNKLETWVHENFRRYNKDKFKVLHLDGSYPSYQYSLGNKGLWATVQRRTCGYGQI